MPWRALADDRGGEPADLALTGGFQLSRSLLLRKPVGNVLTEFVTNRLRKMRSVVARNYQSPGVGSAAFLAAGPGEGKGQREV